MTIIAITNQKGGVGKTTTSINLAAALAESGRNVLLIDLDPQCNASVGCGVEKKRVHSSIYQVLLGESKFSDAVIAIHNNLSLIAAEGDLAGIQMEAEIGQKRLAKVLRKYRSRFDQIIVDCPPALNLLTVNALVAANGVLIPVQCEYYALEGLTSLMETISRIQESLNPQLSITGVLRTMFDGRNLLANEVSEQLARHFPEHLLQTLIPRNIRLAEAPSYGKPIFHYDKECSGARAYMALAGELISRGKQ